jgi:radical SAM superfamily enzyme YgiQ (UPF0313 family)
MIDIVICILPKINPDAPTVGPAVLKSHLMSNGFTCRVLDLNIDLFNFLKKHNMHDDYYFNNDHVFNMQHDDADFNSEFNDFFNNYYEWFVNCVQYLKTLKPKYIGLSLLSNYSLAIALKLSQMIRNEIPSAKIIFGGAQVTIGTRQFKQSGLIDHYIVGDAEIALVELLKGNTSAPGVDASQPSQIKDLNLVMLPNYDDIDWDQYVQLDHEQPVYITGSRGCVKRCTFCNVYELWPDYKFRSAESIIEEIRYVRSKYNRTTFRFTDSLINGSMKSFRRLLEYLKEYKKEDPELKWTSQWIIRSKSQSPELDYQLISESGCVDLEVGIESFSEPVRFHMGKKFTDIDMWWCIDMLHKYKIPHLMLMIVGYPTETEADHQRSIDTVKELYRKGYLHNTTLDGNIITTLNFGNTLMLHDDMPLWDLVKHNIKNYKSVIDWDYDDNTIDVRIKRFNELNELVKDLKNTDSLGWILDRNLENYNKKLDNNLPNNRWDV